MKRRKEFMSSLNVLETEFVVGVINLAKKHDISPNEALSKAAAVIHMFSNAADLRNFTDERKKV